MARPAVYVRPLTRGKPIEDGKDVLALQRALQRADMLKPGKARSSLYADATADAVARFQRKHRLAQTGSYGRETHKKLTPHFDAYGRWLLNEARGDLEEEQQERQRRTRVCQAAYFYYSERSDIGYSQSRPITPLYYGIRPPQVPRYLDCSGLAITCYWVAGLTGFLGAENTTGYGNTWSLNRHGVSVSIPELRPADLVFYGSCSHVAIYVGEGRVVSHGSWPGPLILPVTYRGVHSCRSYLP